MAKYKNGMYDITTNEAMNICKEFLQKNNITDEDICQDMYLMVLEYMKKTNRSSMGVKSLLKNHIEKYEECEEHPLQEEGVITMTELINSVLLKEALDKMMDSLTDKQRLVIELRMEGGTLSEVAEDMGFKSIEHIHQIEAKALGKMRRRSREFIELFNEILNS